MLGIKGGVNVLISPRGERVTTAAAAGTAAGTAGTTGTTGTGMVGVGLWVFSWAGCFGLVRDETVGDYPRIV